MRINKIKPNRLEVQSFTTSANGPKAQKVKIEPEEKDTGLKPCEQESR